LGRSQPEPVGRELLSSVREKVYAESLAKVLEWPIPGGWPGPNGGHSRWIAKLLIKCNTALSSPMQREQLIHLKQWNENFYGQASLK